MEPIVMPIWQVIKAVVWVPEGIYLEAYCCRNWQCIDEG